MNNKPVDEWSWHDHQVFYAKMRLVEGLEKLAYWAILWAKAIARS